MTKCRELIGDASSTDEQITKLLDDMYAIAGGIVALLQPDGVVSTEGENA